MKRVLMLASVASMIDQFNMPNIALLQKLGYQVDVACNFIEGNTCSDARVAELKQKLQDMHVRCYQIDFARNIKHMGQNMKALWQVEGLMKQNTYAFCHCHSPIGGVVARIAGHRTRTKVIYTAHGFHFYQGAPLMNWLLYYPVEKALSRWTDVLITINHEDYARAKKKFHMKKLEYIHGVGIEIDRFKDTLVDKKSKRKEYHLNKEDFVLLSVGEVNKNKNHRVIIEALGKIKDSSIQYMVAGKGNEQTVKLMKLAEKLGVNKQVHFLGYCENVVELYQIADIFCFPSYREGLGVAALEAMASGLPLLTSDIHGIRDYSQNGITGYTVAPDDVKGFADAIRKLQNQDLSLYALQNKEKVKKFELCRVCLKMKKIYEMCL